MTRRPDRAAQERLRLRQFRKSVIEDLFLLQRDRRQLLVAEGAAVEVARLEKKQPPAFVEDQCPR
jgi:hypothetical protein